MWVLAFSLDQSKVVWSGVYEVNCTMSTIVNFAILPATSSTFDFCVDWTWLKFSLTPLGLRSTTPLYEPIIEPPKKHPSPNMDHNGALDGGSPKSHINFEKNVSCQYFCHSNVGFQKVPCPMSNLRLLIFNFQRYAHNAHMPISHQKLYMRGKGRQITRN